MVVLLCLFSEWEVPLCGGASGKEVKELVSRTGN